MLDHIKLGADFSTTYLTTFRTGLPGDSSTRRTLYQFFRTKKHVLDAISRKKLYPFAWGGRGRKFKSCHSDQVNGGCKSSVYLYFTRVFRTFGCGIFLYRALKKCSENSEKSSWYIIWYIGSNGTFHRSVEATA